MLKSTKLILSSLSAILAILLILTAGSSAKGKDDQENIGLEARVSTLEQTMTTLNDNVTNMQQIITSQSNLINTLQTQLVSINADLAAVKLDISNINTSVSSLETTVGTVSADIPQLKTNVASLLSQIQQIETRLTNLESTPTAPPAARHMIRGFMKDVNDVPFFSTFSLRDQTGKPNGQHVFNGFEQHATGSFTLTDVPDGSYTIYYHFGPNFIVASPQQVTVAGSDIDGLVVKLSVPTFRVSGKVIDANGNPVTGKLIGVMNANSRSGGYWPPISADGSFTISSLAPGKYTIMIVESYFDPIGSTTLTITDHNLSDIIITVP